LEKDATGKGKGEKPQGGQVHAVGESTGGHDLRGSGAMSMLGDRNERRESTWGADWRGAKNSSGGCLRSNRNVRLKRREE